jgi:hypothetical protein
MQALRDALSKYSWSEVESIYPQIPLSLLSHHDTLRIAQLLHNSIRAIGLNDEAKVTRRKLLLAADSLTEHYRKQLLRPHSGASVHLLSIYKENKELDKGRDLWNWLSSQEGDDYVSPAVYGAAIEVLAYAGVPLPELETLYEKALIRFPGTFASYHLSPEAVVPDRGQPLISGRIPILLLQGIFTARVLNGDWRNAYLAFDVVLRLYPDVVPRRFFDLIMTERPLAEAIQVFSLASKDKVSFTPYMLSQLLSRSGNVMGKPSAHIHKLHLTTTAIGMLEAQIAAGRALKSAHLSQVITHLSLLAGGARQTKAMEQFNLAVAECGTRLLKICKPFVSGDLASSLNALLHLAGRARHQGVLMQAIQTINELDTWSDITHRTLVTSTGFTSGVDDLKYAWKLLVDSAARDSRDISERDWLCLSGAVSYIGSPEAKAFATKQLALHSTASELQNLIQQRIQTYSSELIQPYELDESTVHFSIGQLNYFLNSLETRLNDEPNSTSHMWPNPFGSTTKLDPQDGRVASNERVVYDELTVDPLQPPPPQAEAQASKIGTPFDVLRFTHWRAVNSLLLLAEGLEKSKKMAVEDAIANREPLKFDNDQASILLAWELSLPQTADELRLRILQLRGRIE